MKQVNPFMVGRRNSSGPFDSLIAGAIAFAIALSLIGAAAVCA